MPATMPRPRKEAAEGCGSGMLNASQRCTGRRRPRPVTSLRPRGCAPVVVVFPDLLTTTHRPAAPSRGFDAGRPPLRVTWLGDLGWSCRHSNSGPQPFQAGLNEGDPAEPQPREASSSGTHPDIQLRVPSRARPSRDGVAARTPCTSTPALRALVATSPAQRGRLRTARQLAPPPDRHVPLGPHGTSPQIFPRIRRRGGLNKALDPGFTSGQVPSCGSVATPDLTRRLDPTWVEIAAGLPGTPSTRLH